MVSFSNHQIKDILFRLDQLNRKLHHFKPSSPLLCSNLPISILTRTTIPRELQRPEGQPERQEDHASLSVDGLRCRYRLTLINRSTATAWHNRLR